MKRFILIALVVALSLVAIVSVVQAEDPEYVDNIPKDSHKIKNKWDLSGTFVNHPGYNWGLGENQTWTYDIHIKEAMYGEYSKGVIHLTTLFEGTEVDLVAHVDATKRAYGHWSGTEPLLAAVGTTNYNGAPYNFMFLLSEAKMWLVISTESYSTYWANGTVWSTRPHQVHSRNSDSSFTLDYKVIHGV